MLIIKRFFSSESFKLDFFWKARPVIYCPQELYFKYKEIENKWVEKIYYVKS